MNAAIHQPQFMPYLGYFDKMDFADCFVFLETVQYKKNEFQNRNRIKTARGPQWLTVPVQFSFGDRIDEVGISSQVPWQRKHLQALRTNYAGTRHWEEHQTQLRELYAGDWAKLADLNVASIAWLRQILGIETPVHWASDISADDNPTQRLVDICAAMGADTYVAGADGAKYMELDRFSASGIAVIFQDYHHPAYEQQFGEFESHLSALDLVLNCGSRSLEILRGGRSFRSDTEEAK